jgi:outer membrane lipoprotein carrier protein
MRAAPRRRGWTHPAVRGIGLGCALLALPLGAASASGVASGVASARVGPAPSAAAVLAHAVKTYADVRTMRASFEQALTNPITDATAVSHGDYIQQRPNRLSVRFSDPADDASDRIVADGSSVWVYVPSATPGRVVRMPIGTGAGATSVDFVGQFLTTPEERFSTTDGGADTVDGRRVRIVILVPKGDSQFTQAKLWIGEDDGVVRQFEVTDVNGTIRHVRLSKIAFNVPVERGTFTFTPPPGVKVVDQQSLSRQTG